MTIRRADCTAPNSMNWLLKDGSAVLTMHPQPGECAQPSANPAASHFSTLHDGFLLQLP